MVYIFWSSSNIAEAKKMIHKLLEKHLIACASMIPNITSIYRWNGAIEESSEVKVIFKTEKKYFEPIEKMILLEGTYTTPEIVQIDISCISDRYQFWLEEQLEKK